MDKFSEISTLSELEKRIESHEAEIQLLVGKILL